jgi:Concanavalin A-like lectin/glucanases superfamily/Ricin-type beta-trefoil lectin domain-like
VRAQDHTVLFSTGDPGVSRAITNWGLDTTWTSADNMRRGLTFMGTNNVTIIRVGFLANSPLTNNDISPAQKATLQSVANVAAMARPGVVWDISSATGAGVDPWYQSGAGTVYPDRWALAMEACQRYYNKLMWMAEPFNEPDYGWGQGSQQNLYDTIGFLRSSTNFAGTVMAGGSTLNDDVALGWFNAIASRVTIGTTHCLAGSANNYVAFLQRVVASNAVPFHPEVHNVCETIIGANYGMKGAIWWGTAERARGEFVKACQGQRIGYAEDLGRWTAAAVYRGSNGSVQAFFGGSERMATTTTYRLFSKERDVFYDGYGPRRDYTVSVPGGSGYQVGQPNAERVVNIAWGADVPLPINGRYIVVNRNSGKALEVPGASTANGVGLDQNTYTGALNQQWDINPLPDNFGGDTSYFTIRAAHDGVTADNSGWSYANGNWIIQWNGGTNTVEQWFFEYAGNNYFRIRSRWTGKVVGVNGASLSGGAQIVQWDSTGSLDQQWRLIPAPIPAYDFVAPAAPVGVKASANAVSVQLNWNANTEPDLASYTVLRATNSGGPYDIVMRGLTTNTFTDKSANQPKTYFYVVKAVDRSLNTSANSLEVSATPNYGPTLVARYGFEGDASDSSGNANHATTFGSPVFASGQYGSSLNLNGTSQYAMAPAGIMASVTNFTIAAWVNWNGGGAWQRIFDFGNDTSQYMFLTPSSGSGTLRFAISTNGSAPGAEQILEVAPLPAGQWRHVAVTRNGNTARLYTNGVAAVSGTVTIAPASFNPALNYLGGSQYPADPLFNGRLDEMFIYNYALSGTEITRLAANQPPPPTVPTTITFSVTGDSLLLAWPSNYVGCRLESNAVSLLATGSWFTVSGSAAVNQVSLPVDRASSNVYYRLVYP